MELVRLMTELLLWSLLLAAAIAAFVWAIRASYVRYGPTTLGGIRVEVAPPHVEEDHIVEAIWVAPVIYTNTSRRPAQVPVLAARTIVRAGRRHYVASLVLERDVHFEHSSLELNPQETLIGDVRVRLPRGETPRMVELALLNKPHRKLRYRVTAAPPSGRHVDVPNDAPSNG